MKHLRLTHIFLLFINFKPIWVHLLTQIGGHVKKENAQSSFVREIGDLVYATIVKKFFFSNFSSKKKIIFISLRTSGKASNKKC